MFRKISGATFVSMLNFTMQNYQPNLKLDVPDIENSTSKKYQGLLSGGSTRPKEMIGSKHQ